MSVKESVITVVCNQIITYLKKSKLSDEELTVSLAQLLIYCGASISKMNIDLKTISWEELEKEYYTNNQSNDLGLGLILNGGTIMQAINIKIEKDSDATATKGKSNVQVSATIKNSQKSSSATNRSKTSKRKS
jgi:hypothetical protein